MKKRGYTRSDIHELTYTEELIGIDKQRRTEGMKQRRRWIRSEGDRKTEKI